MNYSDKQKDRVVETAAAYRDALRRGATTEAIRELRDELDAALCPSPLPSDEEMFEVCWPNRNPPEISSMDRGARQRLAVHFLRMARDRAQARLDTLADGNTHGERFWRLAEVDYWRDLANEMAGRP